MKKGFRKNSRWFLLVLMTMTMVLSMFSMCTLAEEVKEAHVQDDSNMDNTPICGDEEGQLLCSDSEHQHVMQDSCSADRSCDLTSRMFENEPAETESMEEAENITVRGVITWNDEADQAGMRPDSVIVTLYADGKRVKSEEAYEDEDGKWEYEFADLDEYRDGHLITYSIVVEKISGYSSEVNGYDITFTFAPCKNISGEVLWEDGDNQDGLRPESVCVRLMGNGAEKKTIEVNADSNWEYAFYDLPEYEDGVEIIYTAKVEESSAICGAYAICITGYNIRFTHKPGIAKIPVRVNWADDENRDGIRPSSVTVKLLADEEDSGKNIELNEGNGWQASFTDLIKYRGEDEINYRIEEEMTSVITGSDTAGTYFCAVTGDSSDGYVITNSHTPETVNINFEVHWDDASDQDGKRPQYVSVNLLVDGSIVKSIKVYEPDNNIWNSTWRGSFNDMPKYRQGKIICYGISEDHVYDYTTAYDGFVITNSYTPGKTAVSGVLTWDDCNDNDGYRPSSADVKLMANGDQVQVFEVREDQYGMWRYNITNLDTHKDGITVNYTVEVDWTDYYIYEVYNYDIKGCHTPEVVHVTGKITWEDGDDADGIRPESVSVQLMRSGAEEKTVELNEGNHWEYQIKNLLKYEGGKKNTYTIKLEDPSVINDAYTMLADGYNIRFIHKPGKVTIPVQVNWTDNENRDGIRPSSVTVKLLADEKDTGKTMELNEDNGWKSSFPDLLQYAGDSKVNYRIEEAMTSVITGSDAAGTYAYAVTGDAFDGYVITNTHTYMPAQTPETDSNDEGNTDTPAQTPETDSNDEGNTDTPAQTPETDSNDEGNTDTLAQTPETDSNDAANTGTPAQTPQSGSSDAAITISKKVSGLEITAKKTSVTIAWDKFKQNKKTKKIKKIQIQISKDKTFRSNVKTKLVGKKNADTVIKGLAGKTTYYIRIRYLDGNGGASNWSKSKKIRTK